MRALALAILAAGEYSSAHAANVTLEDLVRSTKTALLIVENAWPNANISLSYVELTVAAAVLKEIDGTISFFVVTVGSSSALTASSVVTLTLRPPDREAGSDVSEDDVAQALSAAILSAANAVREAGRGQPPLEVMKLETTINFSLVENGQGGISLDFIPLTAELGLNYSGSRSHTIKAIFESDDDG